MNTDKRSLHWVQPFAPNDAATPEVANPPSAFRIGVHLCPSVVELNRSGCTRLALGRQATIDRHGGSIFPQTKMFSVFPWFLRLLN